MTDSAAGGAERYDPAAAVNAIVHWLERMGWDGIPHGPIPPADPATMSRARSEAAAAAIAWGRTAELRALRRSIVAWSLEQYRRAGLGAVYFGGALEPPDQRRAAVEVLIDAATAYLLGDVLPWDTTTTLMGPFDVWIGGPIFRVESDDA